MLGLLWSLVNPLAQMLVFSFVFRTVLPLNIPDYPTFVFSGLLVWTWFQSSVMQAAGAITDNRPLVRRPRFPSAILPVVAVTTNLVHFLFALPVLLVFILVGGSEIEPMALLFPVLVAIQFLLTLSLSYLVATINVRFRDTQHLLGLALLLLFYLTPIFYRASSVPSEYAWIYGLNPMAQLVAAYRVVLIGTGTLDPVALAVLMATSMLLLWLGHRIFARARDSFAEEL